MEERIQQGRDGTADKSHEFPDTIEVVYKIGHANIRQLKWLMGCRNKTDPQGHSKHPRAPK